MAILREKQVRRREVSTRGMQRIDRLPAEQAANVKAALRVLRIRMGGTAALAKALGVPIKSAENLCAPNGYAPSAGAAVRAAAIADVSVEDVLSGAWPKPGSCPMCGRGG